MDSSWKSCCDFFSETLRSSLILLTLCMSLTVDHHLVLSAAFYSLHTIGSTASVRLSFIYIDGMLSSPLFTLPLASISASLLSGCN